MKLDAQISSSGSWEQLNKKLTTYTTSNKTKLAGDIYERVVQLYLQSDPKYQSKLKHVWLLDEVNSKIKEKLRLPDQDMGIDLIAETFEGEYWAIQAKYRSNINETLSLGGSGGLSTFTSLAFHTCKHITHGLVCTTINNPPRNIKLMRNVGFENAETWLSLDDNNQEAWKRLLQKCKGKIIVPKPMKPRPHQQEAIKEAHKYFVTNKKERGKLIMPCGTGKSIAAFWIARKLNAKSILIAVPSLALLRQTLNVWTKEFLIHKIKPEWICVCSDESAGTIDADDFVAHTYDLGIECTTDGKAIQKFLRKKTNTIKIVFTTYQSGKVTGRAAKQLKYKFDLGILDEAHKTVGSKDKAMAHLLHKENIQIKKRLMMTATERIYRGSKEDVLSMDDPKIYGDIFYQLSFKKAIEAKPPIISDYRIITFAVNDREIGEIWNSNKFLKIRNEYDSITAREFATAVALRKSIKKLKIKKAISFHRSIKRAQDFSEQQELVSKLYPSFKSIETFHVSGMMSTSVRANKMRSFSNSINSLMTNARCLTEGVDLPSIDCVTFADSKKSKVDIVQASGRALRLYEGKKFGYILIPIVVKDNQNPDSVAKDTSFEEVVATVGALSTQDERIAEYFRVVSEGKKSNKGNPIENILKEKTLTSINHKQFEKSIQLKIWKKIAPANWRSYEEAKKYARSLKIKSSTNWNKLFFKSENKPYDIPSSPARTYKNKGWKNWSEFLGTENIRTDQVNWKSFEEAKQYAQSLKLNKTSEWKDFCKSGQKPIDIPKSPVSVYANKGWVSWSDFLGSNKLKSGALLYKSYEYAKKFAIKHKIKSEPQWVEFFKNNKATIEIPKHPDSVYSSVRFNQIWNGWGEFLNTGKKKRRKIFSGNYRKYELAKIFATSLNLNSQAEWKRYHQQNELPADIPRRPDLIYAQEKYGKKWEGWGDFLGANISFRPSSYYSGFFKFREYKSARKFARSLKLKSTYEWKKYIKQHQLPIDIPRSPDRIYSLNKHNNIWKGWGDFLGESVVSRKFHVWREYKLVKKFARSLGIKSKRAWDQNMKQNELPADIPRRPDLIYAQEKYGKKWKGWVSFLGNK